MPVRARFALVVSGLKPVGGGGGGRGTGFKSGTTGHLVRRSARVVAFVRGFRGDP